jgi:hypothetical protein
MNFAWAKSPADHMDLFADLIGSSQGVGVHEKMMGQMQHHASYIKTKLTPEEHAKLHKKISSHVDRLMRNEQIYADEADKIKLIYKPSRVDESKNVSHLQEELSASDPASVWISHFVNSDNPKFSGKSKEQRRQMALGAYYAAKKEGNGMSEESKTLDESPSARELETDLGPRGHRYRIRRAIRVAHSRDAAAGKNTPPSESSQFHNDDLYNRQVLQPGKKQRGQYVLKNTIGQGAPDASKTRALYLSQSGYHLDAAQSRRAAARLDPAARLIAATGKTIRREESEICFTAFRQKLDERVLSLLPEAELDEARIRGPNFDTLVQRGRLFRNQKPTPGEVKTLKDQMKDTRAMGGLPGPQDKLPEETEGQHYCAKHVYSEVYGEGVVVEGQHAEPDDNGNIEWYTVQFEHGEEVIFTEDVEVMMAEYHNNHSPMKKKSKKAKE